jgi:hypothetical protein
MALSIFEFFDSLTSEFFFYDPYRRDQLFESRALDTASEGLLPSRFPMFSVLVMGVLIHDRADPRCQAGMWSSAGQPSDQTVITSFSIIGCCHGAQAWDQGS